MKKSNKGLIRGFLFENMVPVDFKQNEDMSICGVVFDQDFILWIDRRDPEKPVIFWAEAQEKEEMN